MEITALGMIETSGLLTAIEAADAGLKAADVRLLGTDYVRGGLVMVRFEGDVAAVQAAVDAGTAAAQRVGHVISSHVIPRAMPEVFCMLASDPGVGPGKRHQGGCAACGGCEGGMRELRACGKPRPEAAAGTASAGGPPPVTAAPAGNPGPVTAPEEKSAPDLPSLDELRGWKVLTLRSFVRKLPGFPLNAGEIRFATKTQLMDALTAYYKSLEQSH